MSVCSTIIIGPETLGVSVHPGDPGGAWQCSKAGSTVRTACPTTWTWLSVLSHWLTSFQLPGQAKGMSGIWEVRTFPVTSLSPVEAEQCVLVPAAHVEPRDL